MPQDIKIWEINKEKQLNQINKVKLDSEKRLEDWMEKDVSIISDELLIIGRQIQTDFGKSIDLLCLDRSGDVIIIELKRDKTPREIVAQVLDYASWIKELSHERVSEIADKYFGKEGSLEIMFKDKFGEEIPEILNESHKMLIVGSEIDGGSERIIKYLSDSYGVGINAVTFQYFKKGNGNEFLSRVFLIEPSEVDYRTKTKSSSKRKPSLTYEELEEIAKKNGIGNFYKKLIEELSGCFDQNVTTRSSVAFIGIMGKDKSKNTIFSVLPIESNIKKGIKYNTYIDRLADYFKISKAMIINKLSSYEKKKLGGEGEFGEGYFKNEVEFNKFLTILKNIKE